ncbi:MAG: DUF3047 domain-containing protein, partial [Gemmatimonadota bacterium]
MPPSLRLDRIDEATPGDRLPPGWAVREVRGEEVPETRVVEIDAVRALRFSADGAAAWFWRELDAPLDPAAGRVEWRWRVDEAVEAAELADPDLDDAPARFFVVFGRGGLFSSPRMIFYSWGRREPLGTAMRSYVSDRIGVVVVRNGSSPTGTWIDDERDLAADYRAVFGGSPDEVTAVGFMIDTDQTGAAATSFLAALAWRTR